MTAFNARQELVDIPSPALGPFRNGIRHPDLWLWDAWTVDRGDTLALFTLALARRNRKGEPIRPSERNDYPFHIRRFESRDSGASWRDCGAYLSPSTAAGGVMAHNVWSGSGTMFEDRLLFGFTGVRKPGPRRSFLQSICVLPSSPDGAPPDPTDTIVISDPEADYDSIGDAGYYLGPRDSLGDDRGEEGGPILAWRDPYLLVTNDGAIDAFWAAKISATTPAVAHARLTFNGGEIHCELLAPIALPDSDEYTQAEVPKVYRDPLGAGYLLLLSTCNRLREDQSDNEVSKELRLYRAPEPEGPWRPYRGEGGVIPGVEHLFGGAFASFDKLARSAALVAPYTEMADEDKQLSFAPIISIDVDPAPSQKRESAIRA